MAAGGMELFRVRPPRNGTREQKQERIASLEAEHGSALQKLTAQRCRAWSLSATVTASTH
jgi:hypothetical protein